MNDRYIQLKRTYLTRESDMGIYIASILGTAIGGYAYSNPSSSPRSVWTIDEIGEVKKYKEANGIEGAFISGWRFQCTNGGFIQTGPDACVRGMGAWTNCWIAGWTINELEEIAEQKDQMRVQEFAGLISELQTLGFNVETIDDLKPIYLGKNGYVGVVLTKEDGTTERIWVSDPLVKIWASSRAHVAEWLTEILSDGPKSIESLIETYPGIYRAIERALLISKTANQMGLIEDPLAEYLELPADHPYREI